MPFLRLRNIVFGDNGEILSGSASICVSDYVSGAKFHSSQRTIEKLGKVIKLSEDKKSGIFMSPSRGLVRYNSVTDEFTEVKESDEDFPVSNSREKDEVLIHTVFGVVFFLIEFMKSNGFIKILSQVFDKKYSYEKLLFHCLHGIIKDGSKISCDDFIGKSFASYLSGEVSVSSLKSDSLFYASLGDDSVKVKFFTAYVSYMKSLYPEFGKCVYVDSTPLPNSSKNNPFNALSSHGIGKMGVMSRLAVVLDEGTGLPVWFELFSGNILDFSTLSDLVQDVKDTLDIEITSTIVDAGYVSKELLQTHHIGSKKQLIARMPGKKGYPDRDALFDKHAPYIRKGKYGFVRNHSYYYGKREKVTIMGYEEYLYVYEDFGRANNDFQHYLMNHSEEEFNKLKDKEKNRLNLDTGFFILISNIEKTPAEILDDYYARMDIETFFKTGKDYLDILPMSKWNVATIKGKLLLDMIDLIVYLSVRKEMSGQKISVSDIWGKTQSLMCHIDNHEAVHIETPNKQVKEIFKSFNIKIPHHVDMKKYRAELFL